MTVFMACFDLVVGSEGGYSSRPEDPGNWTGGATGKGELRGTKFGISAKQYPSLDIKNLTAADAQGIYQRDYWTPIGGDNLPPVLAYLTFDAAVQMGVPHALQWLHQAAGLAPQSHMTPTLLATLQNAQGRGAQIAAEALARRIIYMAALPMWRLDALGFARRLARLPFQSLTVGA